MESNPNPAARPRLICVDDDEDIASGLLACFKREAFDCSVFTHPRAAIEAVTLLKPAIVLSDYRMQWMNGIAFLEKVRALQPDTVRLLVSGDPEAENIVSAIESGVVHRVLLKPWRSEELRAELRRWFEFHRTRDPKLIYPDEISA